MKIYYRHFLPLIVSLIVLISNQKSKAYISDSLYNPTLGHLASPTTSENTIATNYSTIQKIVPHLAEMQGQVIAIKNILESSQKVEKLWGYYEEAKRDGTDLTNNPLIKELAFSAQYTLYLLNESLQPILKKLNNEHLRVALVQWKSEKLEATQQIFQKDKADLERLKKMQPSFMENPTITNTTKLAILLNRRDSLSGNINKGKVLGEFRKNQGRKNEEVALFYTCDTKKRISENAPENIMDFTSNKAIQIISLDREIYQFRLKALASLPRKEQQYFKLKKKVAITSNEEEQDTKRKFLKKKTDLTSHHSLILKDYNKLIDSFSFEEQNVLREKESIFNHPVIEVIEFWGCPDLFPSFFDK